MTLPAPDRDALSPLAYHRTVVDYLRKNEPEVWAWGAKRTTHAGQLDSLRAMLLRDTYRLEAEAHPEIHAILANAMQQLAISVPATLYQSSGHEMNAMLSYVPGEVHIIVQGPLFERLTSDELQAVFGHELAHYLLWSLEDGHFLIADRIFNDTLAAAGASASQRETYRRYMLHTELFADRGGAVAAGAVAPSVTSLVKVRTGIGTVDAAAYLRQAEEIEAQEQSKGNGSQEYSHPETFIRARALALWWDGASDLDTWIARRLHGKLMLEQSDLPDQVRLQALTRGFLAYFLSEAALKSDAVLAQVRTMFPDWRSDEPAVSLQEFDAATVDDGVRAYLNALMMDLAMIDPDVQELALLHAGRIAQDLGSFNALLTNLRRDAGFGKRELDRYKRQLFKEGRA
jgi:predicted SprT family Zn-dependent metalloprotease